MFKQVRESLIKSELQQDNDHLSVLRTFNPLEYRQPEVYFFGNLEKVKSNYQGTHLDGLSGSYWYFPR